MAGDAVTQIKEKLTIEEVIASYVELHKAGKNLKGKSPFTAEKTPSFYVSPDRGMYYCFSSNQGGDMFTFIEAMEGVDFKGALKILAEKAGVELVPEDPKKRTERETKYAVLEAATKFYEEALRGSGVKAAAAYLHKRGVTDKTIQLGRIGFAPDAWRSAKEELERRKFSEPIMRAAGLTKGEPGKEPYDVFRNRILFPIFDASSRVVAFSGRTLSLEPEIPKYVNSPETELFNKSEILYGYDKARQGIRKFDFSLIVEGQFDVVLAHQAGYNNAVAVSGTALTSAHVNLLGRLSNRVVLALDADRAGLGAVKKAASIMLPRGMDVKVAAMPDGKDPADMISGDVGVFKKIIGQSVHVIEHLLNVLQTTSRDDRTFKIAVREELLPLILRIPSVIDREHFEGVIAERLKTTKDGVHQELKRLEEIKTIENESIDSIENKKQPKTELATHERKNELVAYLVVIHDLLSIEQATRLEQLFIEITEYTLIDIKERIDKARLSRLAFVIESTEDDRKEREKLADLGDKLTELRMIVTKGKLQTLRQEMIEAEQKGELDEVTKKIEAIQKLQQNLSKEPVVFNV